MTSTALFDRLPRPTIFAHRGASAHAPENTLAAFQMAVQQGADAIEFDAKLSSDGRVVIIHDRTVDRTTGGRGQVASMSFAQLRELDAGSWFGEAFFGQRIPSLEEVFETVGNALYINIELTNYARPFDPLPEETAKLVQRYGMADRVLFSSFNPFALLRARKALPACPVGLLIFPGRIGAWVRTWLTPFIAYQALHPALGDTTPTLIEKSHRSGRRVHVWTVNQPADMRRVFQWGADGVFTDDPLLARQILDDQQSVPPQEIL